MASFSAELRVAGHAYPLRHCTYGVHQATDGRGRAAEKVRTALLELVLDVPADNFLEAWAAAAHRPLDGCVVFFDPYGGTARETVSWQAGHGVDYREEFEAGDAEAGAYVCHVSIAAPKLVLASGGPPVPFVAPAARDHGAPPSLVGGVVASPLLNGLPTKSERHFLKNDADPLRDLLGPGKASHPEEWQNTIATLREEGVRVVFRDGVMAYGPDSVPGYPGQLILDPDASIGALRHETQHFNDDKSLGFLGSAAMYKNPLLRWRMEYAAYMQEVSLARQLKAFDVGSQLIGNARDEKKYIGENFGPF